MVRSDADILYVGRSRIDGMRPNLISSLRTAAEFQKFGRRVELWLPAWSRRLGLQETLDQIGIDVPLDVRQSRLLHPRLRFHPFVRVQRRMLAGAAVRYCRDPRIGLSLVAAGFDVHMEVHDIGSMRAQGMLAKVTDAHRAGRLGMLFPTSELAASVLVEAGADPQRTHVLRAGVALEAYVGVTPFDPTRLAEPRIVHIGRINEAHGLRIFEAVARHPGVSVTLVGARDATTAMGSVRLVPFVPPREVPSWYANSDIALMPYQRELGHIDSLSPVKLFEAMAAGRPIIASDLPALRELIDDERTGLLVPPENVDAWIAAIDRLRDDRALAASLAEAARSEAKKHSWRARAERILEAIGRVRVRDPGRVEAARQPFGAHDAPCARSVPSVKGCDLPPRRMRTPTGRPHLSARDRRGGDRLTERR
jgi:glycosyltransferase involved in cell wall biosynthesis